MIPVQFTCGNCGYDVPFMDAGLHHYEHRDHCPVCLYSKHIMFGTATLPPCDGLMHPVDVPTVIRLYITQCETCRFRWASYDENWWAELRPGDQTAMINLAGAETVRQNNQPLAIYVVEPGYATRPPQIPPQALHTRTRVKSRP